MSQPIRLRTFLGLLLVVTTAITFALIGGVILAYRIPQINAEAKTSVQHQAAEKARLLEFALAGLEAQLRPVVTMAQHAAPAEISDALEAVVGDGVHFSAAYLVDRNGAIRAGAVAQGNAAAPGGRPLGDLSRTRCSAPPKRRRSPGATNTFPRKAAQSSSAPPCGRAAGR